jgi:hypothetical protein
VPDSRQQRRHEARLETLPDGAMVVVDEGAFLVRGRQLLRWTAGGYADPTSRPRGDAVVLTPPSLLAVVAAGWDGVVPLLHPSAFTPASG